MRGMARANNPVTGEHFNFIRTTQETDGQLLVFRCKVAPGGAKLPVHRHSSPHERFAVWSRTLGVRLGKEKFQLLPGQSVALPTMVKHQWWNAGDNEVEFRVEAEPAGNLEMGLDVLGFHMFGLG
jgi:quercetin dioxygenase-like cupin family protein